MNDSRVSPPAILIRGISKRYGRLTAVRNLNLEVRPGEIYGFLGLNGAGKTTTIRILLDLIRPTSGEAQIMGLGCREHGIEVRSQIGFLPGEMGFYGDMSGKQFLDFFAGLGSLPVRDEFRAELLERLELPPKDLSRSLREYSTGMKHKLGIVQAMQGEPELLILDEPTEGLDPLMQEAFYQILTDLHRKARTIFMSSHVLSEVERVCTRIGLIRKGELVLQSSVEEIRKMAARRVKVSFSSDMSAPSFSPSNDMVFRESQARTWSFEVRGELGPLIQSLSGLPVRDIEVAEPKLEEILLRFYREGSA